MRRRIPLPFLRPIRRCLSRSSTNGKAVASRQDLFLAGRCSEPRCVGRLGPGRAGRTGGPGRGGVLVTRGLSMTHEPSSPRRSPRSSGWGWGRHGGLGGRGSPKLSSASALDGLCPRPEREIHHPGVLGTRSLPLPKINLSINR